MPPSPSDLWARLPPVWRDRFHRLGDWAGREGMTAALIGGCVRDVLLERAPLDWDVVVEGDAASLARWVSRSEDARHRSHPAFLTHTLFFPDGTSLDIATARTETYPRPGALPVVRAASLREDFVRRDFSVNALALHLTPGRRGEVEDPLGGWNDLRAGQIRALHDRSFIDDPTRIYRAARYAGRYGWSVEVRTRQWIAEAVAAKGPEALSMVRRRNELFHLLEEPDPVPALDLLWSWGVWGFWDSSWEWPETKKRALRSDVSGDLLEGRLALLLGPRKEAALAWMKSTATPSGVRDRVAARIV